MLLELLEAVTGVFVLVYDGQHGLKFRLGRARKIVGPGLHWKWPIVERYKVEETKHTTLDLEPQVIQLKDDLVYEVDCKVMYQIVDLRKALIEIDDLVTGLQNRVVMAVQRVVQAQDRHTVRDTDAMVDAIRDTLRLVEEQWGVRILRFGFSNISPSPATLEITQLDLLARERLKLYAYARKHGLSREAAVALVTGAVVATSPPEQAPSLAQIDREEAALAEQAERWAEEARQIEKEREKKKRLADEEPEPDGDGDEERDDDERPEAERT